jgi:hypothetical protein
MLGLSLWQSAVLDDWWPGTQHVAYSLTITLRHFLPLSLAGNAQVVIDKLHDATRHVKKRYDTKRELENTGISSYRNAQPSLG